jgi:hypothetical protein
MNTLQCSFAFTNAFIALYCSSLRLCFAVIASNVLNDLPASVAA